ncbi:MAG: hypothetical protein QM754_04885 [Tepidisphaeraceae bacterium]
MPAARRRVAFYAKNKTKNLDADLFRNPTSEYRGTPFWSWNNQLDEAQLVRQIDSLRKMGFGGFHMHARTGLATAYLGDAFMSAVRTCVKEARDRAMLAWLYDEDRWPSGFAGGLVTQDPQFRCQTLVWSKKAELPHGERLASFEVEIKDGFLVGYKRIKPHMKPARSRAVWHAYLHVEQPQSWFNNQTYVDTFSRTAIERFIQTTHEHYRAHVGDEFGKTIPAIFTDEPHFTKMQTFALAADEKDVVRPFTVDFFDTFKTAYGKRLEDHLPELFWELPKNKASIYRYLYHDHASERFAHAYGDTLSEWCGRHGIMMTGHMLSEQTLHGQSRAVGEVMRAMRSFQLPGIDLLEDKIELNTAKQAQSLARQGGRPGVLSELYGVTNWDFDFAGHKRQGDWQAALGVTVRVPHLAWVSMAGEAKRDYPASISYQSPWFEQYKLVEDHFARIATVLTRGKPVVRVGLIHPIESYWLKFGCTEQAGPEMAERDKAFADVTSWLAYSGIDFDYLCESILPGQNTSAGKQFVVGEMAYDAIVVPGLRTMRSTTLALLTKFRRAGGLVIFAGEVPTLVDAFPSDAPAKLAAKCVESSWSSRGVVEPLEAVRDLTLTHSDGNAADSILHQFRADGRVRYLFLCNTDKHRGRWQTTIAVRGNWSPTVLDTLTGETSPITAGYENGRTFLRHTFPAHGHLLLKLEPGKTKTTSLPPEPAFAEVGRLAGPVPVTLSEPNVLLLDQAEWRLDGGDWQPGEELLKIDDAVRRQLKLKPRGGKMAQPWTDTADAPVAGRLELRFTVRSGVEVKSPKLALERPELWTISLNGQTIESKDGGWWVDESVRTVALPDLPAGVSEIVLATDFTRKTDVEWCYLLGDFGVAIDGRSALLTAPITQLPFGDWTSQGLPFYAGNVTYHCKLTGDGRPVRLAFPKFKNPLLTVALNDAEPKPVAFAPYEIDLGPVTGEQTVQITAFGNRANSFGPVHHTNDSLTWVGPAAWRSTGVNWAYEYQLKKMGLLMGPIVLSPSPGTAGRGLG